MLTTYRKKIIIRCHHDEQITAERYFLFALRDNSSKSERWIRLVSKFTFAFDILLVENLSSNNHNLEFILQRKGILG